MRERRSARGQPESKGRVLCTAFVMALVVAACGGGGYGGGTPTSPAPTGGAVGTTIGIVGDRGNQSFSPNPGSPGEERARSIALSGASAHRELPANRAS